MPVPNQRRCQTALTGLFAQRSIVIRAHLAGYSPECGAPGRECPSGRQASRGCVAGDFVQSPIVGYNQTPNPPTKRLAGRLLPVPGQVLSHMQIAC